MWVDSGQHIKSGVVTAYVYDTLSRLTKVKYNYGYTPNSTLWPLASISVSGGDVTYGYVENGKDHGDSLKTLMTDSSGNSAYSYDIQGRLQTYTPPKGLDPYYYVWYGYNPDYPYRIKVSSVEVSKLIV